MGQKLAVDIILIPPKEILGLAIKVNRTFKDTAAENYVQDQKKCVPHITLLMGLVIESKLPIVTSRLERLSKKFSPLSLRITGVDISERPDGKKISGFRIEKTAELQNLHESTLKDMEDFFSYEGVSKEMFYSPPPLDDVPNYWLQGLAETKIRENYDPHITLGFGVPQPMGFPIQFTVYDLVLCQLGNHCTCRRILAEIPLG
ncbi:MAG: hypothetical protein CO023_04550 [Flavobacteriales bacterium CG_4_9_14_0_2_um_filter_35_242]|nr:MAG: hypothetical protein CO023_04550 [Flavobacteriales bacterium CG_4_9_14_0_2_um_filter_35_242]